MAKSMAPDAVSILQAVAETSPGHRAEAGEALVERLLPGVSRTFALTIPQLPPGLRHPVGLAYLLCRIADTIEDDPFLDAASKARFHNEFLRVLDGGRVAEAFAADLGTGLSDGTPHAVKGLVQEIPAVAELTRTLPVRQRAAVLQCIRIMSSGMDRFQRGRSIVGLRDQFELDCYCYYVAGVVGQMLTELFCDHAPDMAQRREALMALAVSFGQGLQMTNILKDFWADRADGCCWLPREPFHAAGVNLETLAAGDRPDAVRRATRQLVAVAHAHLRNAMAYAMLIPSRHRGIRRFCLYAIGLAVMTLRKLQRTQVQPQGTTVKISRGTVRGVVVAASLSAGSDRLCESLFNAAASGLPLASLGEAVGPPERWRPVAIGPQQAWIDA